ncbi:MAG: alanine racemase [Deltaproteobacteria bacterium RBG_13_61_14]|nr:MAG: alanine racemase [Deltaproteobacteria bacterium RBG_13_61_14]
MSRPTTALVDLSALSHNLACARSRVNKSVEIIPVVKADAYGHGAKEVVRRLYSQGVNILCVALLDEALALRQSGFAGEILISNGLFPGEEEEAVARGFIPFVLSSESLERLEPAAKKLGQPAKVHLKVDTGMGRIGVDPGEFFPLAERILRSPHLTLDGVLSHLASADLNSPEENDYTRRQIESFALLRAGLEKRGFQVPRWHLLNSAGLIRFPEAHHTAARLGIMLYGVSPSDDVDLSDQLQPVLSLKTHITFLKKVPPGSAVSYGRRTVVERPSLIATIPIGYADGLPRTLPVGFPLLVRARRAPIAGVVTMDMTMLDVTDVPGVARGDEVVIIGEQAGERVRAEDIAKACGTIPYEVLCRIGPRVERRYHD